MNERCIICDHPRTAHFGTGCHTDSFLRGRCDCDFVELPPLPDSATPDQFRTRAAWWQQRAEMAEARMRRTRMGSDRWWHLDRFIDAARSARSRGLDMATALEVEATRTTTDDPADDMLDLIGIESIATQDAGAFQSMLAELERQGSTARDAVRTRLAAEFDALEPRHRRELLEDDGLRGFLEHVGVVSALSMSVPDEVVPSLGPAEQLTFFGSVDTEHGATLGDELWAQTDAGTERLPRDGAFISQYHRTRERVEGYWRHWAQAPSPQALVAYIAMDPDEFKRQLALAIEVLTPPERSRFTNRGQLNGWIASGMRPLFDGERAVPLDEVIDQGYLPAVAF